MSACAVDDSAGQSGPLRDERVILCVFCGFRAWSFFQITRHFELHLGFSFRCGIDSCPSEFTVLDSFRSHLRAHHDDLYPNIRSELPYLDENSCFAYPRISNLTFADSRPESPPAFSDTPEPEPHSPDIPNNFEDQLLEENTDRFVEIILRDGCSRSIPFDHIRQLSSSFISFFGDLSDANSLSTDLRYNLNYLIRNPDIFNRHNEDRFGAVFHKMINISQSQDFFAYMPFKKSLFKLLENFSTPYQLFRKNVDTEDIILYPCSEAGEVNVIRINILLTTFSSQSASF